MAQSTPSRAVRDTFAVSGMVLTASAIAVAAIEQGGLPLPIGAAFGLAAAILFVTGHLLLMRPGGRAHNGASDQERRRAPRLSMPGETDAPDVRAELASLKAYERSKKPAIGAAPPLPREAKREAQITQSVEALRSAASSLSASSARAGLQPSPLDLPLPTHAADSDGAKLTDIAEAIEGQRLETAIALIPSLADGVAQHHEIIVRLKTRTGEMVVPEGLPTVARTTLLPLLEALKVARAVRLAAALLDEGLTGALFSSQTADVLLNDRAMQSLMQRLIAADHSADPAARHVVLAFPQSETRRFTDLHWSRLADLADLGCRFAIEDVADLLSDFELLQNVGFMFIKIDAGTMRQGLTGPTGAVPGDEVPRLIHQLGLTLVVTRMDTATDVSLLAGLGVPFGQGELFRAQERIALVSEPWTNPGERDARAA